MNLLTALERRFGRLAIRELTLYIIAGQVIVYGLSVTKPDFPAQIQLVPALVLQGEVWRIFTFILMPPLVNPLFAFIGWYIFYLMGSALERSWGAFRYNMFLLIGYTATVAVSFIVPNAPASTVFLGGSVFLAFAYLNPNFELYIMFILPVKIRWLAIFTFVSYGFKVITGSWLDRLLILASLCNYFLFFGKDIRNSIKAGHRRMQTQAQEGSRQTDEEPVLHLCSECGASDSSHRDREFRYCTSCRPTRCYCNEHIRNHEHQVESPAETEEKSDS